MKEQQMFYAEPQHYWPAENKSGTELDRLRAGVAEAEATAAQATDWTSKTRATEHAKTLERELRSAEFATKQVQGSRQQAARREVTGFVRSDDGGSYLAAQNSKRKPARAEFMPIKTAATNKSVQWPESFSGRHGLVTAAIAELKHVGIA